MIAMRYGAVPIVRAAPAVSTTPSGPVRWGSPTATAMSLHAYDAGAMLDAIGQAVGLYRGDRRGLPHACGGGAWTADFSWDRSAGAYRNIYGKLLGR